MKVISNILTIEVDKTEYEAMETTLTILNELCNTLPSDINYFTEEYINDATECLSMLLQNTLDGVVIRRTY